MAIEPNFPKRSMSLFFLLKFKSERELKLENCKKKGYLCLTVLIQFIGVFVCVTQCNAEVVKPRAVKSVRQSELWLVVKYSD